MKSDGKFYKLDQGLAAVRNRDVSASAKIVYAVIRDHVGKDGYAFPGMRRLKDATGLNRSTVAAAVDTLADARMLRVEKRGNGRANHYFVLDKSGWKFQPVGKPNRLEIPTRGGRKFQPEAAGNSSPIQTDLLNQTGAGRKSGAVEWDSRAGVFIVPDAILARWQEAFPAVDVQAELASAAAWYVDNPKRRKKDHRRFLGGWMRRANERPGSTRKRTAADGQGVGMTQEFREAVA